jgi:hypothetical protein
LELINAHLEGHKPGGDITIIRGSKFNKVISKLFPHTKQSTLGKLLVEMNKKLATLYYDPSNPSAFSTLAKLQAAVRGEKGKQPSPRVTQDWLHQQDAYTLNKPVRKRFSRNPYSVTNVMDVWETDLLDTQNLSKYNDNYKFLLTVTDVFSRFLHVVPLKNKTWPIVTSAFRSILKDTKYNKPYKRRPLVVPS